MLEAIIVMVLLGVLAAAVVPKVSNPDTITLKAQARSFASDLQRAQLLAITTGVDVLVKVTGNNHYTVQYTLGSAVLTPVDVTLDGHATFTPGNGTLIFNSLGQPTPASTSQSFELSTSGAVPATVSVQSVSGRIVGP